METDDCKYKAPTVGAFYSAGNELKAVLTFGSANSVTWTLTEDGAAIKSDETTSNSTLTIPSSVYDLSGSIPGRVLRLTVKDSNGAESSKECKITKVDDKTKKCS